MKLFEPGKIGKLALRNRIVMGAMGVGGLVDSDNTLSQRGIDYYVARAEGGAALLITGATRVSRDFEKHLRRPRIDPTTDAAWVKRLADAVHAHGARLAIQLTAGVGRVANPATFGRTGLIAPSASTCVWDASIKAREITKAEIKRLVEDFGYAAGVLAESGVDAVELHGHEGYLLDQFKTALWNHRTDEYGGSLEGRLRFPLEVVAAIKKAAGADFPVIYRFGLKHYLPGGRETDEGMAIARLLEAAGVDALDVDAGCYENWYWPHPPTTQPPGCMIDMAVLAKSAVKIPIMAVGKMGYAELAEKTLQQKKADFIIVARALLADPQWPAKVKAGKLEDIRPCIGDQACVERTFREEYISCTVNPVCGMEKEYALRPAAKKKTVLVIGGGPGGMEAARVAASRGHKVTIWEKGACLGGNLLAAAVPDFKADYRTFINYLITQIKKEGVATKFGIEATPELVRKARPDVVIIATGGTPIVPAIPGVDPEKAITAVDVLTGGKRLGKRVVVIGGGDVGCETALHLAKKGKQVTIIEVLDGVMRDMPTANRQHMVKLLAEAGVATLTGTKVREVAGKSLTITDKDGKTSTLETDNIVFAVGLKANDGLRDALKGKVAEVYEIGDCVQPRKVMGAIWEGFGTSRLI